MPENAMLYHNLYLLLLNIKHLVSTVHLWKKYKCFKQKQSCDLLGLA